MAYFVGGALGIGLGFYLREKGVTGRFALASREVAPRKKLDELENKTDEFYKMLNQGKVAPEDFERYTQGKSYNSVIVDE